MNFKYIIIKWFLRFSLVLLTLTRCSLSKPLQKDVEEGVKTILNQTQPHEGRFCQLKYYTDDVGQAYDGCESHIVTKAMCYGQCSTLFIPSHRSGHLVCSHCRPKSVVDTPVQLTCGNELRTIYVPIITECNCEPCKISINHIPSVKSKSRKKNRKNRKKNKNRKRKRKSKKNKKRKNMKLSISSFSSKIQKKLIEENNRVDWLKKKRKRMRKKKKMRRKKRKEAEKRWNKSKRFSYLDLMAFMIHG